MSSSSRFSLLRPQTGARIPSLQSRPTRDSLTSSRHDHAMAIMQAKSSCSAMFDFCTRQYSTLSHLVTFREKSTDEPPSPPPQPPPSPASWCRPAYLGLVPTDSVCLCATLVPSATNPRKEQRPHILVTPNLRSKTLAFIPPLLYSLDPGRSPSALRPITSGLPGSPPPP